jgi:hypothetical protein
MELVKCYMLHKLKYYSTGLSVTVKDTDIFDGIHVCLALYYNPHVSRSLWA